MKKWLIGAGGLVLLLLGIRHFSADSTPRVRTPVGAAVRAAPVQHRNMPVVEHTIGTVVSPITVQVTARVQGILERAYFKERQFVKKGALLFQIDPRGFAATLAQAQAISMRDEAQLTNAKRDLQRYVELSASHSTSAQLLDTARANVQVLTATAAADKAAVRMAELSLDYAQIRSPIDGKTGPLLIQVGNMISGTGAAPLVSVVQLQPILVSFALPQSDLPRIQARQRTGRLMVSLDGRKEHGTLLAAPVTFIDNAINSQTGTIELRATFPNSDLSLVPGQLLNVTVVLDDITDATVVPRDAVNDGPDGPYVYVVTAGKAIVHHIKVLFDDTQFVAVDGDIRAGDAVITEGQLQVSADGPVRVMPDTPSDSVEPGSGRVPGTARDSSKGNTLQLTLDPK
jgi:multidrug efflux system membrane fusion protein